MRDSNQYLRFSLSGAYYLISGAVNVAIDQRDNLEINNTGTGHVCAWRSHDGTRWPAYCLDQDFKVAQRDDWQRAMFFEAQPTPVGLIADHVQLLPDGEAQIIPFRPLGPPVTAAGHLFSGAWVRGSQAILVFDPKVLATFLHNLGG
ncbi:MAG: hypothetical protein OES46_02480 [Gammaproteobacteria bacterium]|nr:hypothetical protein [Gammaproteobacteria bacterium]